jgi:predicted nucleotidyltransferase
LVLLGGFIAFRQYWLGVNQKGNQQMDPQETQLRHNHQMVLNHFVTACQTDERVVAAFLGGSYAKGTFDAYSDLDLYLITTDETYEDFLAGRGTFIRLLGKPLFLEEWAPHGIFYIFPDSAEGELWIGRESQFNHIHVGPYRVLLDKTGILDNADFPQHKADQAKQIEALRQQIYWFWHELSHFITAMGRGQLWWAYGQLEAMRFICINLERLRHGFLDRELGEEPYFKVEQALPVEHLSSLQATYCPMEQEAMRHAVLVILSFYQELAPLLARTYGLTYPADLERVMVKRLEKLDDSGDKI